MAQKTAETKNVNTASMGEQKQNPLFKLLSNQRVKTGLIFLAIMVLLFAGLYLVQLGSQVYIEDSKISAPVISLTPQIAGTVEKLYVKEGDYVSKNQILARVAGNNITAKTDGIITYIKNTPGQNAALTDPIIQMYDPSELRLVGSVQEDKGLSQIKEGQKVTFTVDAFEGKEFTGIVESVAAQSTQEDIVFSISDKRQEKEFNITAWFNETDYPELKNGMSAKMTVHK